MRSLGVQRHLAVLAVLAVADDQVTLASRHHDILNVQSDGFGDAGAGVEGGVGDRLVPQTRGAVGLPEQPELVTFTQGSRSGLRDLRPLDVRGTLPAPPVEVVQRRQVGVDSGRFAFGHGLQMSAIVTGRPVPGGRIAQRIPVDLPSGQSASKPDEVLPHPGAVDTNGVAIQRAARPGDQLYRYQNH